MKKTIKTLAITCLFIFLGGNLNAQKNNIRISQIPEDVTQTLTAYMDILLNSATVEEAAQKLFVEGIIGGGLLDVNGTGADSDIIRYSLKKDFQNVKFYEFPPVITGVTYVKDDYDGYGVTLIRGNTYKMWLKKKNASNGPPAPVPVMKTADGTTKVVTSIGSL